MNGIKVALHNLGCKVNAYETEAMSEQLQAAGYEIVSFEEKADVYIVNTCTVTNIADRKSRQMLHKSKKMNEKAVVVAVGCYVQAAGEDIKKDKAIDIIVGNNKKSEIVHILDEYFNYHQTVDSIMDLSAPSEYENQSVEASYEGHSRAFLKIQDGCNQFCSYCIIPYARGRIRSKKLELIEKEVGNVVKNGISEVVLTGIHLSSYGLDFIKAEYDDGKEGTLIDVIERVASIEGVKRIRLGSLEPRIITKDFLDRLSKLDTFCPHFHLSMQSGCNQTLKRMNRHYTADEYYEKCELIRDYYPMAAITTDVIVGFPGETQEEYEKSKKFIEKVAFSQIHVFKYSRRKGTVADKLENQVEDRIKSVRSDELIEVGKRLHTKYISKYIRDNEEVLCEEKENINGEEYICGYTKTYVRVAVPVDEGIIGKIVDVNIINVLNTEILLAEMRKMY